MTLLLSQSFGDSGEVYLSFETMDDYPHFSNWGRDGTPFHLFRVGEKVHYTDDMLLQLLAVQVERYSQTECPKVVNKPFIKASLGKMQAAIVDLGDWVAVLTIVFPVRGDR